MNNLPAYLTIIAIILWVIARIYEVKYAKKSGKCNARLYLGDDYGDGTCTMKCGLHEKHIGNHEEIFLRNSDEVFISWKVDERRIKLVAIIDIKDIEKVSDEIWNYGQITDTIESGAIMIECDKDQIENISKIIDIKELRNEGFADD